MVANPAEGRLTEEQQAEQLIEARRHTTKMKRAYRDMRDEADAKAKAERWARNHRKQHQKAYDDLSEVAHISKLNRRERRHFARRMNVFKTPDGWGHFMSNYKKTFKGPETVVRTKGKQPRSNIQQALASAKAEKESK